MPAATPRCLSCERMALEDPPPRDCIVESRGWRVAHAFDANLEGWLVVLPRRHVHALDELSEAEADALGALLRSVTSALRSVVGCEKTYVLLLAEKEGFSHVHFHVVPRAEAMPEEYRGSRVFALLGNPALPEVTDARKDEIAVALRSRLCVRDEGGATARL